MTPPANVAYRNAGSTRPAPMTAPAAAKSFTSPAPVAPMTWPGNMSARPSARPASEDHTETPVMPAAAKATPASARLPVTALGTRLVRRSTRAPQPAPATTVATTIALECTAQTARDCLPQHVIHGTPHTRDPYYRNDRNQSREQRVLDQVLGVIAT